MKLKGAITTSILVASAIALALLALGIGYKPGEKYLEYEGNLWCVSNFVEKEPKELLSDGQPAKHQLLEGREDWIRKDQITVDPSTNTPEQEAMSIASKEHFFESATKEELISALERGDKEFFTHHFNSTATASGHCITTVGKWINDATREECFGTDEYETVRELNVNITSYSPCINGNTCNCPVSMGGGAATADPSGSFKVLDGRLRWVKSNNYFENYVFAQPTSDHIVSWNERERFAIVVPGFNDNKPIYVRDHYAPGWHFNQDWLDLFKPCSEIRQGPGGKTTVKIVDLTKKKTADKAKLAICPKEIPIVGPSYGDDYTNIAPIYGGLSGYLTSGELGSLGEGANDIVRTAVAELGNRFTDDRTKYNDYNGTQWCSWFVTWVYRKAGFNIPRIGVSKQTLAWFSKNGHSVFQDPALAEPGDIVVWSRGGASGHIGIVAKNDTTNQKITTIEGNNSRNQVAQYTYSYNTIKNLYKGLVGFGRW
ncbi:MAG: CHAP domain protein [candidate division WS2 bacterium ADurb.Bin280]|uniref:CHAP domain protein n=1 Tax=candidate division WS2 bacterium ADurb.Bin280 TaxID=1852829 RepID=A0A1V5SDK6_9BACT|nr:MAG: CHAP domain protein [candidate division WS2 bacterium ADurb.Bin280]